MACRTAASHDPSPKRSRAVYVSTQYMYEHTNVSWHRQRTGAVDRDVHQLMLCIVLIFVVLHASPSSAATVDPIPFRPICCAAGNAQADCDPKMFRAVLPFGSIDVLPTTKENVGYYWQAKEVGSASFTDVAANASWFVTPGKQIGGMANSTAYGALGCTTFMLHSSMKVRAISRGALTLDMCQQELIKNADPSLCSVPVGASQTVPVTKVTVSNSKVTIVNGALKVNATVNIIADPNLGVAASYTLYRGGSRYLYRRHLASSASTGGNLVLAVGQLAFLVDFSLPLASAGVVALQIDFSSAEDRAAQPVVLFLQLPMPDGTTTRSPSEPSSSPTPGTNTATGATDNTSPPNPASVSSSTAASPSISRTHTSSGGTTNGSDPPLALIFSLAFLAAVVVITLLCFLGWKIRSKRAAWALAGLDDGAHERPPVNVLAIVPRPTEQSEHPPPYILEERTPPESRTSPPPTPSPQQAPLPKDIQSNNPSGPATNQEAASAGARSTRTPIAVQETHKHPDDFAQGSTQEQGTVGGAEMVPGAGPTKLDPSDAPIVTGTSV